MKSGWENPETVAAMEAIEDAQRHNDPTVWPVTPEGVVLVKITKTSELESEHGME